MSSSRFCCRRNSQNIRSRCNCKTSVCKWHRISIIWHSQNTTCTVYYVDGNIVFTVWAQMFILAWLSYVTGNNMIPRVLQDSFFIFFLPTPITLNVFCYYFIVIVPTGTHFINVTTVIQSEINCRSIRLVYYLSNTAFCWYRISIIANYYNAAICIGAGRLWTSASFLLS